MSDAGTSIGTRQSPMNTRDTAYVQNQIKS